MDHDKKPAENEIPRKDTPNPAETRPDADSPSPAPQAPRGEPVFPPIGPTDTIKIRERHARGSAPPGREIPGHPGKFFGEAPVSDDPDVAVDS